MNNQPYGQLIGELLKTHNHCLRALSDMELDVLVKGLTIIRDFNGSMGSEPETVYFSMKIGDLRSMQAARKRD
jgi:hypothetical protein